MMSDVDEGLVQLVRKSSNFIWNAELSFYVFKHIQEKLVFDQLGLPSNQKQFQNILSRTDSSTSVYLYGHSPRRALLHRRKSLYLAGKL
jgi:hypothetical protein